MFRYRFFWWHIQVSRTPEILAFRLIQKEVLIAISNNELSLHRFPHKHAHVRAFLPRSFVRVGESLDPHSSQLESKCVSVRLLIYCTSPVT